MIRTIICDSSYDYKYRQIFDRIDFVKVIEGDFKSLIVGIINSKKPIFHVRYFKTSGVFNGFPRYLILILLIYVKGGKILYTCHNIYEHTIKSKFINDFYRFIFSLLAFKIIYFHESMRGYNYKIFYKKSVIANFGSFKEFKINKNIKSAQFNNLYNGWKHKKNIDIISISAARLNHSKLFFDKIEKTNFNSLMINPKKININTQITKNQFRYYKPVYHEINNLLLSNTKVIGFIGHFNISVSTSLFMFSSYGIPVICYDIEPNSIIVSTNKIGEVVEFNSDTESIIEKINTIKNNYDWYKEKCDSFIKNNNWHKCSIVHKDILK